MASPIKVIVGAASVGPDSTSVVIPVTFEGMKAQDAQKAAAILADLANVIQGGHVNMFGLLKLATDIGLVI
jgi:hypothetical protein